MSNMPDTNPRIPTLENLEWFYQERLIPEYEGETPADYPGNNDEYSVSGYHYDKRG